MARARHRRDEKAPHAINPHNTPRWFYIALYADSLPLWLAPNGNASSAGNTPGLAAAGFRRKAMTLPSET